MNRFAIWLSAAAVLTLVSSPLAAQTDTTFTYQGNLAENGNPADGTYDIDFELWDALTGGTLVESPVSMTSVPVAKGQFAVELDFGAAAFDNTSRWIEITVNGSQLSPRQPVNRSPYSIQTRGIFVDENNNVGIGTSTPSYPLHVVSDDTYSIYGKNTAASDITYAVYGLNESTAGYAVYGLATASTGPTYGGRFRSSSTGGRGVFGWATASSGSTYGAYGLSQSSTGRGVHGYASASSGTNYGVSGSSQSTSGSGVHGLAFASTGTTYGGRFESTSSSGRGVYGEAVASSGETYGGYFVSNSTFGKGVYGLATASTGTTYGVYGISLSPTGRSVYGAATANTGTNYGGYFTSLSTSGRAVYGDAAALSGTTYGGWFESISTTGRGVYGIATRDNGVNYGGWFESRSPSGRAIFGLADASSGVNYGVVGHSNSSSGFDFWASGAGTNYGSPSSRRFKSNVVPIADPLGKLAQLQGVYFDWDDEHGGTHDVGMIAEEVGKILPEIVNYEDNGYDAIGMDYSKLSPLLVEGINALRAENDILRERLAVLESLMKRNEQLSNER